LICFVWKNGELPKPIEKAGKIIMRLTMHSPYRIILIALLLSLFFFTGCTTKTSVRGTWKKIDYSGQALTSIMVVGIIENQGNRFRWENGMATALREGGLNKVITSLNALPYYQEIEKDKKGIIDYVNNNNIDGVLVTRVVDVQQEEIIHPAPADVYSSPRSYYNNFGSYYSHAGARTKGYTTTETNVLLETNLYEVKNQELVWSFSSETTTSSSVHKLIDSVSKKILEALKNDRLI